MCTKIWKITRPPKNRNQPWDKLWIMWITWCISAFFSKIKEKQGGQLSTKVLWTTVDKVDNRRIECMVCASCTVWGKWGNHGGKAAGRGCRKGRRWEKWEGRKISEFLEVCGMGTHFLSGKWFGRNLGRRDCGRWGVSAGRWDSGQKHRRSREGSSKLACDC